jgi:hypothetical protein
VHERARCREPLNNVDCGQYHVGLVNVDYNNREPCPGIDDGPI